MIKSKIVFEFKPNKILWGITIYQTGACKKRLVYIRSASIRHIRPRGNALI